MASFGQVRVRGGRVNPLVPVVEGDRHRRRNSPGTAASRKQRVSVERDKGGTTMKRMFVSASVFFKILKGCLSAAWQDSDCHYHIPKGRFKDNGGEENSTESSPQRPKAPAKNYFLGSFRDCVLAAWEASDQDYYIPKNRFQDVDFNKTAYRSSTGPGLFRRVGGFLSTFRHCISMSWEASDTFYHLPRRSYRNADFVRDLMKLSPEPEGKLLYRPYTIGRGVVLCEGTGKGWSVGPSDEKPERISEFISPPGAPGPGDKPELEM